MAGLDAKMADYFQRFIVPLAALFLCLRILAFIYGKVFPYAYAIFCNKFGEKHHKAMKVQKDKLFSDFHSLCKENKRFFALEIGCGPGRNFGLYPPNTSLIVVEPNEIFKKDVVKNAAQHPSLEVTRFLDIGAEDLREHVADASQDAVVSTLTLCSVNDIDAVISEVHRILKPGGRFYFIEHTEAHTKRTWTHLIQRILAPVVFAVAHCCVTSTPWLAIDRAGFSKVQYTKTDIKKIPRLFCSHVIGFAVK